MMSFPQCLILLLFLSACTRQSTARALQGQDDIGSRLDEIQRHLDPQGNHLVEDDGSMDAALLNYLFAKQLINRLATGRDLTDLQQKRSYWKQCAFNAVSCFGRK